jgi:hypothetical protein
MMIPRAMLAILSHRHKAKGKTFMTLATGFGFLLHDTKIRTLVSLPRERQFLPLGEPDGKLVWGDFTGRIAISK